MSSATENRAAYLAWLRRDFPSLYRDMVPQITVPYAEGVDFGAPSLQTLEWESPGVLRTEDSGHPSLAGFWDSVGTTFNTVVSNVTNSLPQLASTYAQYQSQKDILKLNSQRASAGLAPLEYRNGQLVPATGLPYTQAEYGLASTGVSATTVLLAGAAILGVVLLTRSR